MLKNREKILTTTLGAMFAALSVMLNLGFDMWIKSDFFGFPFYSIPLILAAIILGPKKGFIIGFVADTIFGIIKGYMPWFVLSSVAWATIPAFFNPKENKIKWFVMVMTTYLTATMLNSFAMYMNFPSKDYYYASLPVRLSLILPFGFIILIVSHSIYLVAKDVLPKSIILKSDRPANIYPEYLIKVKELKISKY